MQKKPFSVPVAGRAHKDVKPQALKDYHQRRCGRHVSSSSGKCAYRVCVDASDTAKKQRNYTSPEDELVETKTRK